MPLIEELFAFCAEEAPGDEGVCGWQLDDGSWMPLVGADMKRVESLRPLAKIIAKSTNKK